MARRTVPVRSFVFGLWATSFPAQEPNRGYWSHTADTLNLMASPMVEETLFHASIRK